MLPRLMSKCSHPFVTLQLRQRTLHKKLWTDKYATAVLKDQAKYDSLFPNKVMYSSLNSLKVSIQN